MNVGTNEWMNMNECTYEWMIEGIWMNVCMNECTYEWMNENEWTNEYEWMNKWIWMNVRMNIWMNERMNMNVCMNECECAYEWMNEWMYGYESCTLRFTSYCIIHTATHIILYHTHCDSYHTASYTPRLISYCISAGTAIVVQYKASLQTRRLCRYISWLHHDIPWHIMIYHGH